MYALTDLLDPRTIAITTMLVYSSLALIMLHSCVRRRTYPGFRAWTAGVVCWAAGVVLNFNPGLLGGTPGFIASNALLLLQLPLIYHGFALYCGLKDPARQLRLHYLLATAALAGMTYYRLVDDSYAARASIFSLTYALVFIRTALEPLLDAKAVRYPMQHTSAAILLLFSVMFIVRAVDNMRNSYTDIHQDPTLKIILLLGVIAVTVMVFTMLIMTASRVESELVAAQDRLRTLAETDHLTGINNRRHFMAQAKPLVETARRYNQPLSLLLIDVDHFKRINDTFGHQTGDVVLAEIAGLLQASVREVDVLGRIGGEEFGLLLPQTDLENACRMAERLRRKVEAANPGDLRVTISIGAAAFAETDLDTLLALADNELYAAKNGGRNRVMPEGGEAR